MTAPAPILTQLYPADLGTFLGTTVDPARAQLMIDGAVAACSVYLDPLPLAAKLTVLSVAARAFANPQSDVSESVGSFHVQHSPGGIYLTRADKLFLRALAGRGGAFSVDPTPVDAGTKLAPWDQNTTWIEGEPQLDQWSEP